MKTRLLSLLLAGCMLLSLAACGAPGENSSAGETSLFTDDCGRQVEIPAQISRVVPAGPLAQMLLLSIAPELMVGTASRWDTEGLEFIPKALQELPYLGRLTGSGEVNLEQLALTSPQIIIDIGDSKAAAEDLQSLQEQTGIPTVFLSASLETMPQTYRKLGALLGEEEKAEELAKFCEKVYSRTLSLMEQVGDHKVDALYVLGEKGLNVIARSSYHSEVLDMLTNNLAVVENPSSKGLGNEVTMEQIALWDPEFVIFAPGSIYTAAAGMDVWGRVTAISTGRYVEVPQGPYNWMGNPPGAQRYLALIWLPAALYPQYCDYDVKADITEYFRLFYGWELTDGQYACLTQNAFLK